MMGWVVAASLAALLMVVLLAVGRLPRSTWEIVAAALLVGLAGYAWQGHPGLAGSPVAQDKASQPAFDEDLAERRRGMAERYGPSGQWLMLSDGLGRQGKTREAANVLLAGLRDRPDDANLWLGLGNALMSHAGGALSPGAEFAYRRALALEPEAPAPRYFYGLALAQAGELKAAREMWAPLAQAAPAGSRLKAELEANIARIDAMLTGRSAGGE